MYGLRRTYSTDTFKLLRVYRNYTSIELLNALMVNRAAASPWLVANSMRLYKTACRTLGKGFTNAVVEKTFGKVFLFFFGFIAFKKIKKSHIMLRF